MDNVNYENLKNLKKECNEKMKEIEAHLVEIKEKLSKFYNIMRWENIPCSSEEYSELFDNMVYPYEENDINYHLSKVLEFLDEEKRRKI